MAELLDQVWIKEHTLWFGKFFASLFSLVKDPVETFYFGEFAALKWIVTFILVWIAGIWFWIRSFKNWNRFQDIETKKIIEGKEVLSDSGLYQFWFILTWFVRIALALAFVHTGLAMTIRYYINEYVSGTYLRVPYLAKFTICDATTWPTWLLVTAFVLFIRLAFNFIVDIITRRPLAFVGVILHIIDFASIGWLLGHLDVVLNRFVNYINTVYPWGPKRLPWLFPVLIASALVVLIQQAIPGVAMFFELMMGIAFLLVVFYPVLALLSILLGGGSQGGVGDVDVKSSTKTTTIEIDHLGYTETIDYHGGFFENIILFNRFGLGFLLLLD